jgi:predicted transcriptional regulator of viral defense system
MADSVYISANLTKAQLLFLHLMNEREIEYFTISEVEEQLNHKFDNINEVLENLVQKKFLFRLQKGYYAVKNFNNQNVIGTFISQNSAVAYWSALSLHGLTSRFPNKVFIQTTRRKRDKTIIGVEYKFVTIPERKRIGITTDGYGNNSYPITDIEKTIIDCFDLPKYSGGFDLLVSAFSQAKLSSKKMIEYCEAINNISATKRLGFLSELLDKKGLQAFIKYAKLKVNKKYNLIDSAGSDSGEFISGWRLRLNVSRDEILNLSKELY